MVLPRATAFRSLLGSSAIRTSRRAGGTRQWGQARRRGYASGGHEAKKSSSDLPWLIGSVAITVPSTYWLLQNGPDKAPSHGSHGEKHEEKHEDEPEAAGKSEDTSERDSGGSDDESKQDTPATSEAETETVKTSGEGDAEGSTAQNVHNSEEDKTDGKDAAAASKRPIEGGAAGEQEVPSDMDTTKATPETAKQKGSAGPSRP